jgi:hypothetical protein
MPQIGHLKKIGAKKLQSLVIGTSSQWKIISIPSMEVDFWGVKSIGCENSHATEVKFSNIP